MADENFTSFTEVDPNTRITVTSDRVSWVLLSRDEDAYSYSDKGVAYFNGNFEIKQTYRVTAANASGTSMCGIWALTNLVDDYQGIDQANGDFFLVAPRKSILGLHGLFLIECDGGTQYGDSYDGLTINTNYYLTIKRDLSIGTYGTIYCYIYSDYLRQTLVDTLSVTCHTSVKSFRYLFAVITADTDQSTITHSGYTENMEVVTIESSLPEVFQQPLTNIIETTATGNGYISSIGSSSIIAHGHCWKTKDAYLSDGLLPLTSDSNVDNGAGAVGSFTSAITGLTPGTMYCIRAYATNSYEPGYSANYFFIAGDPSSYVSPREIAVGNTILLYTGINGKRYYIQGVEY